jgi:threonine dehydratase
LMFPIAVRFVTEVVLVTDDAIVAAQRLMWDRFRLIAEPGGATAIAALLSGRWRPPAGARVGILVCGGNADPAKIAGGSDAAEWDRNDLNETRPAPRYS